MTQSTCTQGGWRVMYDPNEDDYATIKAVGPYGSYEVAVEVDMDDANLIAAAPDLLDDGWELSTYAACSKIKNTEEFLEGLFERVKKFQKTATKARGES